MKSRTGTPHAAVSTAREEHEIRDGRRNARRQRGARLAATLGLTALLAPLASCGEEQSGPVTISAIGSAPEFVNPNLNPLDPPSAILLEATAQGLVRFDADGQIEAALAQRWIVSNDGLRYTFRIKDLDWSGGSQVTVDQVTARLRAASSRASRNPLKPLLASIAEVETMTDDVLEISLSGPRPNFLQLLAQPEMAILRNNQGTGPYRAEARRDGSFLLRLPPVEDSEEAPGPAILLRGERAALAVARFKAGSADLVTGGTAGTLAIARAASPAAQALRFDPVYGLFGLAFERASGALGEADVRQALSMALDRPALTVMLQVPDLQPRDSLVPAGLDDLAAPSAPSWSAMPLPERRTLAARAITAATDGEPLRVTIAVPREPGYRMLVALIRQQWRSVGVIAEAVEPGADADLRLVDQVAPAMTASWYLRSFSCAQSPVCSEEADALMDQGRSAPGSQRPEILRQADRLLQETAAFIPIAAPVRWHLVSARLTGFTANSFGHHTLTELIAETG